MRSPVASLAVVDSPADAYADADDPGAFFDLLAPVAEP